MIISKLIITPIVLVQYIKRQIVMQLHKNQLKHHGKFHQRNPFIYDLKNIKQKAARKKKD
jgi:hypothetical protein